MPANYRYEDDGIYCRIESGGDSKSLSEPIKICSPFKVIKSFRDAQGGQWGRQIELLTPEGSWRSERSFEQDLEAAIKRVRARLVGSGLRIETTKEANESFDFLIRNWRTAKLSALVDHPGWVSSEFGTFVLGNMRKLGRDDIQANFGLLPSSPRNAASAGTLAHWRDEVAALCIGNPLAMVAVSTAFVGPLLRLCDWEGGGLHLRGPSSCGKSSLLMAANSVWGDPTRVQNWRVTDNALEHIAKSANDTSLCLDELRQVNARALDSAA